MNHTLGILTVPFVTSKDLYFKLGTSVDMGGIGEFITIVFLLRCITS